MVDVTRHVRGVAGAITWALFVGSPVVTGLYMFFGHTPPPHTAVVAEKGQSHVHTQRGNITDPSRTAEEKPLIAYNDEHTMSGDSTDSHTLSGRVSDHPRSDVSGPDDLDPMTREWLKNYSAIYVIEDGDTLTSVSRKFGVSVECIAQANGIDNVHLIYREGTLRIPRP